MGKKGEEEKKTYILLTPQRLPHTLIFRLRKSSKPASKSRLCFSESADPLDVLVGEAAALVLYQESVTRVDLAGYGLGGWSMESTLVGGGCGCAVEMARVVAVRAWVHVELELALDVACRGLVLVEGDGDVQGWVWTVGGVW